MNTLVASIPSPSFNSIELGPLNLRLYGLMIALGVIAAVWLFGRRLAERGYGTSDDASAIAMWGVAGGIIGSRLYHVATDWQKYFGEGANPADALKIWEGGLGIWGAVALGAVGAWIGCRRRGIPLPAFGDALAPAILLAQAIGRLGNWFNQELYGGETTVPWGLEIYQRADDAGRVSPSLIDGVSTGEVAFVVHPTFLYELLWNVAVVVLLVLIDRRFAIGHGRLFALYVAGYCAGRFWIELMRTDVATEIAGIRINTFTSGIVFVLAVAYVIFARKGREDPATLGGTPADASATAPVGAGEAAENPATGASPAGVVTTEIDNPESDAGAEPAGRLDTSPPGKSKGDNS